MIDIRPSILAADLLNLKQDIERVAPYIEWLHFDVMDAHFVPNLSFGPSLLKQIKNAFPNLKLDVHLMMDNPASYIDTFVKSGADAITIHAEIDDMPEILASINKSGVIAGLSVKPGTDVKTIKDHLAQVGQVLIMTVEPGFGGQKFDARQLSKARYLRSEGYTGIISVDGGINPVNAADCVKSGVTAAVMGTAVFKSEQPSAVIKACMEL